MTNIITFVHNFFDVANRFIYVLVAAFILIIITYGTAIKNNKFLSLICKIGIVGIYFYLFTTNYKHIKTLSKPGCNCNKTAQLNLSLTVVL